jgi:hypothetical protein
VTSLVVIVAIFITGVIALVMRRRRSQHLKQRFGAEYDRALLEQQGDSRRAEALLADRLKRVKAFSLHALSPVDRETYSMEWMDVQRCFVDDPSAAVGAADRLINRAMTDRGYPESDFEQRAADISVSHPGAVQNYRAAHEIVARHGDSNVTTEELRQSILYFRTLFYELLGPAGEELLEPAWDELLAPPGNEPAREELPEPARNEPASDELLEPAKIEEIDSRGRRVTRERAS